MSVEVKKVREAIERGAIGFCLKKDDGSVCHTSCELFEECWGEKKKCPYCNDTGKVSTFDPVSNMMINGIICQCKLGVKK